MNFALLGYHPHALPLLEAIARDPDCRVTATHDAELPLAARASISSAQRVDDWADLLSAHAIDAVIVAGADESTLVAAKQLFSAGRPLIVVPHPEQGTAWMYEMSLMQQDAQAELFPFFPLRHDARIRLLHDALQTQRLGALRSFEMERRRVPGGKGEEEASPLLSVAEIDEALLTDADLLRFLGGRYSHVTALRTGTAPREIGRAHVTLAGSGSAEAVWTFKPVPAESEWTLTALGEEGEARLEGDAEVRQVAIGDELLTADSAADIGATDDFLQLVTRRRARNFFDPDWEDAIRAGETVEATHESIRKRRTIDLYAGTHSEQTVFKTQMTAIGCGVLFLTLFGVIILSLVDEAVAFPDGVRNMLRIAVFLPLFLFLLLQLLYFAARPAKQADERNNAGDPTETDDSGERST